MSQEHRFLLRLKKTQYNLLSAEADRKKISVNECITSKLQASSLNNLACLSIQGESIDLAKLQNEFSNCIEAIVLFGSRATGVAHQTSDADLLFVLSESCPIERDLYRKWDKLISPHSLFSPQFSHFPKDFRKASSLWFEIAMDGIVLWDPHLDCSRYLGDLRNFLLSEKYERKLAHGQGYWVLRQGV